MPAKIVETKPAPFKRVPVDPITLDIVENALRNARVEMDATTLILPDCVGVVDDFANILIRPNS